MSKVHTDIIARNKTRERLKDEKPIVLQKMMAIDEMISRKEQVPPNIEIAFRYNCNIHCDHCFATNLGDISGKIKKKDRSLTLDDLREISRQANEMGAYQYILQGGEPTSWADFEDIVAALNPKEFYMGLVTNGVLLNEKKIFRLREIGIDKMVMSIDAYHPRKHSRTVELLNHAKRAGLRTVINTVATTQNVRTDQFLDLIKFAQDNDFVLYVNGAAPIGEWAGKTEFVLSDDDRKYLFSLSKEYDVVRRDSNPHQGEFVGCPAFRETIYITEFGDVLPCAFLHMSAGNIWETPIKDIIKRGLSYDVLKNRPNKCLSCDDKDFIENYMVKMNGPDSPPHMDKLFGKPQ
jgi:MoaA/NifB/PqqE/SkfB family radical SAM enzyme